MDKIEVTKWVCVNSHYTNKGITTVGKVYEFIKEISICPITLIDLSHTSFIGDDGQSYLIHDNEQIDMSFISLEQYRQDQLNKIL
jgi:hypothetical protein